MAFIIKTNISQTTGVLVDDLGITIPGSGGFVDMDGLRDRQDIVLSRNLRTYCTDDAYGTNSSTLIVNDGNRDIPQIFVERFIGNASIAFSQTYAKELNSSSTGILTGGHLTADSTSTIAITSGSGIIVDNYSDGLNPTITNVFWPDYTSVPVDVSSSDLTFFAINADGNIVTQSSIYSKDQYNDLILIGTAAHSSRYQIDYLGHQYIPAYDLGLQFTDFATAFGQFNIVGNIFSADASNLQMYKSAGQTYQVGGGYIDSKKVPNISIDGTMHPVTFVYAFTDSSGNYITGYPRLDIDSSNYDTGHGLAEITDESSWTNQRIFFFTDIDAVMVQYDTTTYPSKADALSRLVDTRPVPYFLEYSTFRGWLSIHRDASNLADLNQAEFTEAGRLGLVATSSGGGGVSGEINTASNVGSGGSLGLYYQKVGVDLQFKGIHPASNKISITDDLGHHDLDIDVVPAYIYLDDLGNVTVPSPVNNNFLVYDSTTSQWVNKTFSALVSIPKIKSGTVLPASFTGTPKKATVSFASNFDSTNYAITITGSDNRTWTYESKAVSGFVINSNANQALTGNTDWHAIQQGEY